MLPSFPIAQKILNAAFEKRVFSARARAIPREIHPPVRQIREGRRSDFQREDRKIKPLDVKEHIVRTAFEAMDGKGMTREAFDAKASELGEGLGRQMLELLLGAVREAVDETGNSLLLNDGKFTQENIIQMLEMTQHGFDEHGQPTNVLLVSSELGEELRRREAEWAKDESFKAKVEEVKKRKKEEFDEREARRRLVG